MNGLQIGDVAVRSGLNGRAPSLRVSTDRTRRVERGCEDENLVTLKKAEWNVLVDLIQSGQLGKV